jgi:hypothetical protein
MSAVHDDKLVGEHYGRSDLAIEDHNLTDLLRNVPDKTGFMAPSVLQARPSRLLMTTARSGRFSGSPRKRKRA